MEHKGPRNSNRHGKIEVRISGEKAWGANAAVTREERGVTGEEYRDNPGHDDRLAARPGTGKSCARRLPFGATAHDVIGFNRRRHDEFRAFGRPSPGGTTLRLTSSGRGGTTHRPTHAALPKGRSVAHDRQKREKSSELHPLAETLDLSDRALVVSFQTVSVWRSSASNSTGGL